MLVISRKAGESIVIGENIEVTILEITDTSIKLGIEAPKNIKLLRKELIEAIQSENLESSKNIDKIFKITNKK
jgi:carbon storage regulator